MARRPIEFGDHGLHRVVFYGLLRLAHRDARLRFIAFIYRLRLGPRRLNQNCRNQ